MKYALILHRSNVYDRQILGNLLQNFIHEISRDCFAVQYIVWWTLVPRYHETRDLVTPLFLILTSCVLHVQKELSASTPKDLKPSHFILCNLSISRSILNPLAGKCSKDIQKTEKILTKIQILSRLMIARMILSLKNTMVSKVINELKLMTRIKIFGEIGLKGTFTCEWKRVFM